MPLINAWRYVKLLVGRTYHKPAKVGCNCMVWIFKISYRLALYSWLAEPHTPVTNYPARLASSFNLDHTNKQLTTETEMPTCTA